MTIRSVLITGATGYIGSNLARKLMQEGMETHIIVRLSSKLDLLAGISDRLHIHTFHGDTQELLHILHTVHPDTIFHLAALFVAEHKPGEIKPLIESNILFGTQLLEAAAAAGVKHFINTGTHWQHYNTEEYCPSGLYAATKQAFQDIARYYVSSCGIKFVTVKLTDTYGPFDPRPKLIPLLKRLAKSYERLEMSGGEQQLGLLYIDDVTAAFSLAAEYAAEMPSCTEKSFIAAPKEIFTLKEVVRIFEQAWNVKLNISFGERPYRKREVMRISCTDENIFSGTGITGLFDGLKKVFQAECEI